jgi:hypothetical protein
MWGVFDQAVIQPVPDPCRRRRLRDRRLRRADASTIWVRDGNGSHVFNGAPGWVNITINVNGANTRV